MPIPFLAPDDELTAFPDVNSALSEPNGLLMAGGTLSPKRLVDAYRSGIFPWYEEGNPVLWWSPDPRCIIWPDEIRISRSLAKVIRQQQFSITHNVAFREVMKRCAAPRQGSSGTWITDEMIDAYCQLNLYGVARSIEVWHNDLLVGGLYGISLGGVYIGESMFSTVSNASKVALVHLAQTGDYKLLDCQLETDHLLSMGATIIPRDRYIELLNQYGDMASSIFRPDRLQPDVGNVPPGDIDPSDL